MTDFSALENLVSGTPSAPVTSTPSTSTSKFSALEDLVSGVSQKPAVSPAPSVTSSPNVVVHPSVGTTPPSLLMMGPTFAKNENGLTADQQKVADATIQKEVAGAKADQSFLQSEERSKPGGGFGAVFKQTFLPTKLISVGQGQGVSQAQSDVASEYEQQHPYLSMIPKIAGTVANLVLTRNLGGGFGLSSVVDDALGPLKNLFPSLARAVGYSAESGSIFGITSAIDEGLNQLRDQGFDPVKLAGATAHGVETGIAYGTAGALPTTALRVAGGTVAGAAQTTLDQLIANGHLQAKDITSIIANGLINGLFELAGGTKKTDLFAQETSSNLEHDRIVTIAQNGIMSENPDLTPEQAWAQAEKAIALLEQLPGQLGAGLDAAQKSHIQQELKDPTSPLAQHVDQMLQEVKSANENGGTLTQEERATLARTRYLTDLVFNSEKRGGPSLSPAPQVATELYQENPDSLTVIRHGAAEGEKASMGGWSSVPLAPEGIKNAQDVADKLPANTGGIVTSDLTRAKQSAEIISERSGVPIIAEDHGLRSWNLGKYDQGKAAEVEPILEEHASTSPDKPLPGGGESFNQYKDRFLSAIEHLHQQYGPNAVVVTHSHGTRILKAWNAAGNPHDHSIDMSVYSDKANTLKPGGMRKYGTVPGQPGILKVQESDTGVSAPQSVQRQRPIMSSKRLATIATKRFLSDTYHTLFSPETKKTVNRGGQVLTSNGLDQLNAELTSLAQTSGEEGFVKYGEIVSDIAKGVRSTKDFIEQTQKNSAISENMADDLYRLKTNSLADAITARRFLESITISPADAEAMYHYDEDKSSPLTPAQKELYDREIKPLVNATNAIVAKVKPNIPLSPDDYTPRFVVGRFSVVDRIKKAAEGVLDKVKSARSGSLLNKTAPSLKRRIMHSLTDEHGNRFVISIKGGKVTLWHKGIGQSFGTVPSVFAKTLNYEGRTYTIGDATTKEIEAHTNIRYHKNVLVNRVVTYLKLREVERSLDWLANFEKSPQFSEIAVKADDANIPDGWRFTSLMNMRQYKFEPHVAAELDVFAGNLNKGADPMNILTGLNRFMRNAIFYNPTMHVPNIATHWFTDRGVSPWLKPSGWRNLISTTVRAMNAVMRKNDDYTEMLRAGGPLMSAGDNNRELYEVMLAKIGTEIQTDPHLRQISKLFGYANPVNWAKSVYKLSSSITWISNDVATMQRIYERIRNGHTLDEAIYETGKHIPDYRIPAHVFNSEAVAKVLKSPNVFMFSAYHYGALRSYAEMIKDLVKGTGKQRMETIDKLLAMFLAALVIHPFIDKLLQKLTGNPLATLRRAGSITLPYNTYKFLNGQEDMSQFLQSISVPAVGTEEIFQQFFNLDFFTGNKISTPDEGRNLLAMFKARGSHFVEALSPVQQFQKLNQGKVGTQAWLMSLVGVSTPSMGAYSRNIQSMVLDERPALSTKIKDLWLQGKTQDAISIMKDFNYRLYQNTVSAYEQKGEAVPSRDQIDQNLHKSYLFPPTDKQLQTRVSSGKAPKSNQTIIERAGNYIKAIGTDPGQAFHDIFHGQVIKGTSGGAVLVERMSLSQSEAIKKSLLPEGANMADYQLDHIVPLEIGGTNERSNLQLLTKAQDQANNAIENYLGKALSNDEVKPKDAVQMMLDYKAGKTTEEEIMKRVGAPI